LSKHNDIGKPGREDFLKSLLWFFLLMEGFECLLLTEDRVIEDLALSYTSDQLHRHVVAQALFANPPPEGVER
jgi:hypothetical protein